MPWAESTRHIGNDAFTIKYPWWMSSLFDGFRKGMTYPACGTQGVPLRAAALSYSRILRITAPPTRFPAYHAHVAGHKTGASRYRGGSRPRRTCRECAATSPRPPLMAR